MSDRQPNPADLTAYYQGLRISAQPFVPNVHAMPFQPGGGYPGGQQMYRGGGGMHYAMGGHGMYGLPPHMMVPQQQRHQHGYIGGPPNFGHPGMTAPFAPRQQHPPQHPMKSDYNPPSHGMQPDQSCRSTNKSDPSLKVKQKDPELPVKEDIPAEVDSWEERAEETSVSVSIEPVGTKGAVTNQDTPETINKPDTHLETERHLSEQASVHSENSNSPSSQERVPKTRDTPSSEPTPAKVHLAKTVTAPPKHENEKENVNIVFIGHVDAGKSTIGGHIMYLTGQVDKRTLEKYEREAKEKNRETWYLSWALDTNQEERDKGKTVEVGRAFFETDKKRFTILDAPGHSGFVPNMISGTVQADIGILVISARRGEFETGFEKGGQTREHAMLAKTAGVKHLVVLVNKMDDPTVGWSEERYEECKTKLTPFLKKVGFNPKTDLFFIPVSGLTGANLKEQCQESHATWYNGPAFIPYLDNLPSITREDQGPFRMPIADRYKDMGTVIIGKIESGSVCKGSQFLMMPNRSMIEVLSVIRVEEEVSAAYSGDNIKLKIKGVEEEDISPGFVMCSPHSPCHVGRVFDAQVVILEYKSIICAGFSCVLHIHSVVEEVEIAQLLAKIDKKTGKKLPEKPKFIKQDHTAIARFQTSRIICMEIFKEFPAMARFTLRDEGKTIAIGKVLKIIE